MGSRHDTERGFFLINPPESPYKHLQESSSHPGRYEYVPSLTGLTVRYYHATFKNERYELADLKVVHETDRIPLLPPIEIVPPAPLDAFQVMNNQLENMLERLIKPVVEEPTISLIGCEHGSYWSLRPEEYLRTVIERHDIAVAPILPKIGGRKRIQEHGIILPGRATIDTSLDKARSFLDVLIGRNTSESRTS